MLDLFKIGLGPSSSHTVGPMRAAARFIANLGAVLPLTERIVARAYGSLAWTGRGHGTDRALILGLSGAEPDMIDPGDAEARVHAIAAEGRLGLPDGRDIPFAPATDVVLDMETLVDRHPNAMDFQALDSAGQVLAEERWYSVGGGFVEREGDPPPAEAAPPPYPFTTGSSLLALGRASGLTVPEMVLANETRFRPPDDTLAAIDTIAQAMLACIERGLATEGELPGGLAVRRRAPALYRKLSERRLANDRAADEPMRFASAYAIAVNEENAAGGRVVTAPTNGAAGVVPAVLRYYLDFHSGADRDGVRRFFLAATAIGGIIKRNASISGAEVGCQGEVGSAAAMAAAGLVAAGGGTNAQIENAAEIAMEHHLGLTCDPVGGLVQIPCIERNAFGAVKAITAASLASHGDGLHKVSLDQVVETMRQTGLDMSSKYRETARGGLAVNVPEC
ncbi:MAG: L-serine ammonia-lyase [Rhodospirillaceae bacterium]|nr:L-serine ammonia-lyase [Rhodospirillaceae bacterium]